MCSGPRRARNEGHRLRIRDYFKILRLKIHEFYQICKKKFVELLS